MLVLKDLVGLHRTIQIQLLQHYWLGHRLELKKVGKTIRPFRYGLNKIPYDYTVEVRIKGLDLIDRVPDELWMEVRDIVQESGIMTISMEKKCKKKQNGCLGSLTNSCEMKRGEKPRRKGKI